MYLKVSSFRSCVESMNVKSMAWKIAHRNRKQPQQQQQ